MADSAEHVVMSILLLVRNYTPAHEMIERGDWVVSNVARNTYDLENKVVGTIGESSSSTLSRPCMAIGASPTHYSPSFLTFNVHLAGP